MIQLKMIVQPFRQYHVCRRFQFKVRSFRLCQENISSPMLKSIQSHFNLTYLSNDEYKHLDKRTGNTDILDIAIISPNLTKNDIQFLIGDDLGSDHLPIKISIDTQPHRNIHTNHIRSGINLTRPTEKCLNQLSRRH